MDAPVVQALRNSAKNKNRILNAYPKIKKPAREPGRRARMQGDERVRWEILFFGVNQLVGVGAFQDGRSVELHHITGAHIP